MPAPALAPPDRDEAEIRREILRQVRRIELRTRRRVETLFGGEYHSRFKGQGMEFAEVREYQPGDDVRTIDWNVTARMRHPYVKKHIEERELTVLVAIDLSASEQFGTRGRFKADLVAEVASVLAMAAVRNNDRVGLVVFTDRIEHFVPPKKGRRHVLRLIRDILAFRPVGQGTDLAVAVEFAGRVLPHRGIVFLLSDFIAPPGAAVVAADGGSGGPTGYERALRVVARRHDVVAVRISDRGEETIPDVGVLMLADPETGEQVALDTGGAALRMLFAADVAREREEATRLFRRLGVDQIELSTDAPYTAPLLAFFRRRGMRGR